MNRQDLRNRRPVFHAAPAIGNKVTKPLAKRCDLCAFLRGLSTIGASLWILGHVL